MRRFREEISQEITEAQFRRFKKRVRYGTKFDGNRRTIVKSLVDLGLEFMSYRRVVLF